MQNQKKESEQSQQSNSISKQKQSGPVASSSQQVPQNAIPVIAPLVQPEQSSHLSNGEDDQEWNSIGDQQQFEDVLENAVQQLQQLEEQNQQQQELQDQSQPQSQQQSQQQQQQHSLGCEHYLRNCSVQAPCCKIFYVCKLCHDQKYQGPKSSGCKTQRMPFSDVKQIKCLKCNKQQQPSLKCINPQCQITFGKYACLKCKLYENRSTKVNDIFHCNQCSMCRRGKQDNFFHCKKCGYCRHISQKNNHKCAQNVAQSQCPVCLQILKYSTKYYVALPCGHLIHQTCLAMYNSVNCPICGMATQKLSQSQNKRMDQAIEQTRANLPKQVLDKKVDILCNQCLHKSLQQPFHFFGIKCQGCGTYNTKMI